MEVIHDHKINFFSATAVCSLYYMKAHDDMSFMEVIS
jgi:hypothetical protein